MPNAIKIACVGEVMIEITIDGHAKTHLGVAGDTYNTAVYLRKIRPPDAYSVTYITALGTDSFSERILAEMRRHGLRTDYIDFRENLLPGLYAIETDADGERSFSYWRNASAARTLFVSPCSITHDRLLEFDMIFISGITLAVLTPAARDGLISTLKLFRKQGGQVAFDSNYRPRLWEDDHTAQQIISDMWAVTDIALPSLDDELLLFDDKSEYDIIERLLAAGVTRGALKRGAEGPLAIGSKTLGSFSTVSQPVDSTAAGDSFNAGFLAAIVTGGTMDDALSEGHVLASEVIQYRGAIVEPNLERE